MKIALAIYLLFSFFQAGVIYGEDGWDIPNSIKNRFRWLLALIFSLLFMGLFVIVDFIWEALKWIWKEVNAYTQISFYWSFYLTKKWNGLSDDELKSLNEFVGTFPNQDSWKVKLQRKGLKMINRRNNYTYRK